jgi:putative DNA methylase
MTDAKPTRPAVFIEKIFPVTLLNQQVYYEHGGNPFKGLHRWYSRKPLSFSRASVLGSILPGDVTPEEFEYLLGLNRRIPPAPLSKGGVGGGGMGWQDTTTKLYKMPPGPERIKQVHDLCEKTWGTRTPTVLDAFAGGGSIPFEAARYGLNVLASDLNPVAVVTMKAAIEYPLKFGPDLQVDIDKWVKWVGDEAKVRLGSFFPSQAGETVVNYLWAHTVVCPSCESVVPLSPNWWLSKTSNYAGKGEARKITSDWYAVRPVPNLKEKRVDFELVRGKKGKGDTIVCENGEEYDPSDTVTIARGVGKCPCCKEIIEDEYIKTYAQSNKLGHQAYSVVFRRNSSPLEFRLPTQLDISAIEASGDLLDLRMAELRSRMFIPDQEIPSNTHRGPDLYLYGIYFWRELFNYRQLLTLSIYSEIVYDARQKMAHNYEPDKLEALSTYLSLIFDRCVDENSRLGRWNAARAGSEDASSQHALNIMWNYPERNAAGDLWRWCADVFASEYVSLCSLIGTESGANELAGLQPVNQKKTRIQAASADALYHIENLSVPCIVTDPPYYDAIRYGEISDFFYVWLRANLLDTLPELFVGELTDKDNEAIANPGRFRDMGASSKELANQDYEAKMALAFAEYHRVLRDDGVMTVQFNHKDSGAWDTLAKSLIDSGFEITASWAVSTENPQNLHQAQKNSVSSTVLLVCRKRDPNAGSAWWDDIKPELNNLVAQRAPEFEANDITGIDLYLSAFGPALNVFSRAWPVLDSSGHEMRPEIAFAESRKAIANYRFHKLTQTDTTGFDPITTWYILAWDAFRAREFPFDDARQLALAIGGFNLQDLSKTHKLAEIKSGTCRLLSPDQRLKKRAFSTSPTEFTPTALIDSLHAIIALYLEEGTIEPVRRFLKTTDLLNNDLFMRAWEVTLKVIPRIGDERKRIPEEKALADLWLAMDEIKAKVRYIQPELTLEENTQGSLF